MLKTILLTLLALIAFAGNSVLCRLALADEVIDAASFSAIRLLSGATFLLLLVLTRHKAAVGFTAGRWSSAGLLFLYAVTFSYAYISLDTGTGALILFGSVQLTMVLVALFTGNKLLAVEWLGLFVALAGLMVLLLPGATSPSLTSFILMAASGVAWAFYTLAGQASKTPLLDTAGNFIKALPLLMLLTFFTFDGAIISNTGIALAIASGAITSGLGYAIWYSVLTQLSITQAAIIQLTVPIIAAFGGVIFAQELISRQLMIASLLVLGGIFMVIVAKHYARGNR
ncbi:MAG: DMT family transporter [Cognaticolwellia sp.]